MTELHPIVYTRPFDKDNDFRFFARPTSLVGDAYFVERMRNVLATESYRGGINGKRWHVLRTRNAVVIGFATQEFERYDDVHGRRLRGYYGFEMPLGDVCLPDVKLFCALDSIIVEPLFHEKNLSERDFGNIKEAPFEVPEMYHQITEHICGRKFNTDRHVVNYIPNDVVVDELLKDALSFAVNNENFECVIGLNSRKHAEESQVQNCLCYEQPTALRVSVRKAEPNDTVRDVKHSASSKDHRSNRSIPTNPPRPQMDESELGWGKRLFRSICSVVTNDSKPKPPTEPNKKQPQPLTPTIEPVNSHLSAPSSVVASHRRGWNIAKPKRESPIDIPDKVVVRDECSMAEGSETKLSDIAEKLAALHSQWYQLSIGNQAQLDMCNHLADILQQCGAVPITNESIFDPERHVDINSSNPDRGAQIIATLIPGWMHGGRVIQKAKVRIASQPVEARHGAFDGDELIKEA